MQKIKVKNFGPIKEGCLENGGWLDIKKVTVFIGNQGSGKSTVAKLISSLMWLEKAIIRGDKKNLLAHNEVIELLKFHRIEDYLKHNSVIEYEGNTYNLKLVHSNKDKKSIEASKQNNKSVKQPKIMYVPAERNFLSSIENINKISNLLVGSLREYSVEFRNTQLVNKNKSIDLPINNTKIVYNPNFDENYIVFNGEQLKLSHASSGFHSIVPLHWVTKYLVDFIKQDEKELLKLLSSDLTIRRNNDILDLKMSFFDQSTLSNKDIVSSNAFVFNEKKMKTQVAKVNEKYICKHLVNIVEEPEQNLFPLSQKEILYSLLGFNNMCDGNKLIITTHSPYLISYLTLAVEANRLKSGVKTDELINKLDEIVPLKSTLDKKNLIIYQLDEKDGTISKLKDYKGLPSDENYLNESLAETNELFSNLLDIEDLCQ